MYEAKIYIVDNISNIPNIFIILSLYIFLAIIKNIKPKKANKNVILVNHFIFIVDLINIKDIIADTIGIISNIMAIVFFILPTF